MSTTGHYHRRWSAGTAGSSVPSSSSLTSTVEPSTYGTSWNSVRWNKPNTGTGYRSLSTLASHFEPRASSTSHYSPSPIGRTTTKPSSLGPSVSVRASRFDSTIRDQKDKYRTEARDLINKWTSRERNTNASVEPSYISRKTDSSSLSSTAYPYRTSTITPRAHSTSVSRFSSYDRPSNSYMSPSPTPQSHTLKSERPWRQRMAESQRIRATHGDEVSAAYMASRQRRASSSRRGSLSQTSDIDDTPLSSALLLRNFGSTSNSNRPCNLANSASSPSCSGLSSRHRDSSVYGPNSRFTSSFASYSGYKPTEDTPTSKYMSRSYSPIRCSSDVFKNPTSRTVTHTTERQSSQESINNRDDLNRDKYVSAIPKNPSIRESSKEKELDKRRYSSSKERTARRNSRQRSFNLETTSSSEEDIAVKEETRKQRRRKIKRSGTAELASSIPPIVSTSLNKLSTNNNDIILAPQDTVTEITNQIVDLANKDIPLSPPTTPRTIRKLSKNGLSRAPSKSQIIKSPSIVEVPGISKSESVSSVKSNSFKTAPSESQKKILLDGSTQDDESQYSAVAHFKPFKPMVKRLAPVPGLWNMAGGEENISKNKALNREESSACTFLVLEVKPNESSTKKIRSPSVKSVAKKTDVTGQKLHKVETGGTALKSNEEKIENSEKAREKPKKILPKKVAKVSEDSISKPTIKQVQTTEINKILTQKQKSASVSTIWKDKPRDKVALRKIRSAPTLQEIGLDKTLTKKSVTIRIVKVHRPPQKVNDSVKLNCKEPTVKAVTTNETIANKEQACGAQVIVDTPQKGINISKLRKNIKAVKKELYKPEIAIEPTYDEKFTTNLNPTYIEQDIRRSASRAAEVLDEMRDTEPSMEWNRDDLENSSVLILPDKSVLEEYVRRKRGRLERLHSEPIHERDELSDRVSPCPSTTSELLPACTSRIFHPSSYGHSFITTPSRNTSIEPVSTSATPTIAGSAMLLDSIQPTSSYNNFNCTPQGFLRANTARAQCARPIQFEAPKSAFEERMQMQANVIRKASVNSTTSDDAKTLSENQMTRRGSDGMNISSTFEAAVAEKQQQGVGRHERYAAHIPVHRSDVSGRQSATSVDSSQSGVLETATKQLDQVIDQARHRHHQHRSKFKEAIDYLDQIFEDLKKECEPSEEATVSAKSSKIASAKKDQSSITKHSQAANKQSISSPQSLKTNSLPTRGSKNKFAKPPSPLDVVITADTASSNSLKTSKPSKDSSEPPAEYAVTETIVLPKKTDKLDFTRRWLQDDLLSIAHQGPVNLIPDSGIYGDEDEHSLGSCSAEVAAINIEKIRKTSKQPQIVLPPGQPAPIRPQPFRPQPGYISTPGSSNGTRHFPLDYDNQLNGSSLQRVASFDHMAAEKRLYDSHHWRSGSQEPYHTLQSVRSDDSRPSPSAFHALGNRGSSLRASLRSLPDASVVRTNSVGRRTQQQPPMSIDQLVADLELNTDTHTLTPTDKRRSFPTTLDTADIQTSSSRNHSSQRDRSSGSGVRTSYHAPSNQQKTSSSSRYHNSNQKGLDEVTSLLNTVVGDMNNSNVQLRRKQQQQSQQQQPVNGNQMNPFETINQEKINPSRVEAMHNMFERGGSKKPNSNSNNSNNNNNNRSGNLNNSGWRAAGPQPFRRIQSSSSQHQSQLQPQLKPHSQHFDEDSYYDIAEFAVKPYRKVSPPRQVMQTTSVRKSSPSRDSTPAYPSSQPPLFPPTSNTTRNGSATSSTNGGYYSSSSSMAGGTNGNQVNRRSSLVGHQSISSRAPSVDDEDDGFYDNIGVYDDRRYSHGSDMDVNFTSSRPPGNGNAKSTRIGSFLRKIGGRTNRPPGSAASLISLNKVANETPIQQGILQKSNSMSSEPWKNHILQPTSAKAERGSSNGLGTRLKNTLFGSKKRLNG